MDENLLLEFKSNLKKKFQNLAPDFRKNGTNAFRIYDHNINGIPWSVDIYDKYLHILDYSDSPIEKKFLSGFIDEACKITYTNTVNAVYKNRKERKSDVQHMKISNEGAEFEVLENGLKFIVNLNDYIDSGLFLDHRISREMIMDLSEGRKVLNLFSYTGSFSVYAGSGQADFVTSVDMSGTYINWAERNWKKNHLNFRCDSKFIQSDVFSYLEKPDPMKWDVIILDPPSFSNSRKMNKTLRIEKDYSELINRCLQLLNKNGVIFYSTNLTNFIFDKKKINSRKVKKMSYFTRPLEFRKNIHNSWIIEK